MPFVSRSQANTCYRKNDKKWNCDEWASETKWCQIPYKKDGTPHAASSGCKGKKCAHYLKKGSRGGVYFECPGDGHKVYLTGKLKQQYI